MATDVGTPVAAGGDRHRGGGIQRAVGTSLAAIFVIGVVRRVPGLLRWTRSKLVAEATSLVAIALVSVVGTLRLFAWQLAKKAGLR
jgi:hypothetical protein